jgi:hypothetical protein
MHEFPTSKSWRWLSCHVDWSCALCWPAAAPGLSGQPPEAPWFAGPPVGGVHGCGTRWRAGGATPWWQDYWILLPTSQSTIIPHSIHLNLQSYPTLHTSQSTIISNITHLNLQSYPISHTSIYSHREHYTSQHVHSTLNTSHIKSTNFSSTLYNLSVYPTWNIPTYNQPQIHTLSIYWQIFIICLTR